MKPKANLITQRFGRLIVVQISSKQTTRGEYKWQCLCDCGNTTYTTTGNLRSGNIVSCGCKRRNPSTWQLQPWVKQQAIQLKGKRFRRLTVLGLAQGQSSQGRMWLCRCDCGKVVTIVGARLRSGKTKSCECLLTDFRQGLKEFKRPPYQPKRNTINQIFSSYRGSAHKRGYQWKLSKEEFVALIKLNCFYCGNPPSKDCFESGKRNGIDRIINSIGYIPSNVVPCCQICNVAKSTLDIDDFRKWITKAYNHLTQRKDSTYCRFDLPAA